MNINNLLYISIKNFLLPHSGQTAGLALLIILFSFSFRIVRIHYFRWTPLSRLIVTILP